MLQNYVSEPVPQQVLFIILNVIQAHVHRDPQLVEDVLHRQHERYRLDKRESHQIEVLNVKHVLCLQEF